MQKKLYLCTKICQFGREMYCGTPFVIDKIANHLKQKYYE